MKVHKHANNPSVEANLDLQANITYRCHRCGNTNIVKNGTNKCGNPQYHCKDCAAYRVMNPKRKHTAEKKDTKNEPARTA